jgi:hypothetical protein
VEDFVFGYLLIISKFADEDVGSTRLLIPFQMGYEECG